MAHDEYGVQSARERLPELLDRAHRGERVLITKHGKPYAALVEPAVATRKGGAFARLRGSGKGLWGRNSARWLEKLRREW